MIDMMILWIYDTDTNSTFHAAMEIKDEHRRNTPIENIKNPTYQDYYSCINTIAENMFQCYKDKYNKTDVILKDFVHFPNTLLLIDDTSSQIIENNCDDNQSIMGLDENESFKENCDDNITNAADVEINTPTTEYEILFDQEYKGVHIILKRAADLLIEIVNELGDVLISKPFDKRCQSLNCDYNLDIITAGINYCNTMYIGIAICEDNDMPIPPYVEFYFVINSAHTNATLFDSNMWSTSETQSWYEYADKIGRFELRRPSRER